MAKKKALKNVSKVSITPLGDRVLIKPLSDEELGKTSPAGIIIPDTVNREKADRGKVIAVGEGKLDDSGNRIALEVKDGDRVIFSWGEKIEIDNEDHYIVSESSILAVIK